jgi:hypothetical protein
MDLRGYRVTFFLQINETKDRIKVESKKKAVPIKPMIAKEVPSSISFGADI